MIERTIGIKEAELRRQANLYLSIVEEYTKGFTKSEKLYNSRSVSMVSRYKLICELAGFKIDERIEKIYASTL